MHTYTFGKADLLFITAISLYLSHIWFENRINSLVDEKIKLNQFDECPISMGEIATVKRTIMEVLPSVHHSRVDYDKDKRW